MIDLFLKRFFSFYLILLSSVLLIADGNQMPNVVIVFNDDMGYGDLGCYGATAIHTPRVDNLATEGMKFTDFYMASSVCSASRAALLTGCYPLRVGVPGVFFPNRGDQGLDPEHITIAEILKTAGYNTKAVGKWHLGDHPKYLPTNQGFDSYYGIPYSNDMTPAENMKYADDCLFREEITIEKLEQAFALAKEKKGKASKVMKDKVPLMYNEECIEFPVDQKTITQRFATEGIHFITESVKEEKPFFLYLANSMPHTPLFASSEFLGKSKRGLYGDVIEEIDYNTGRILDHLDDLKIADNTIVIFTSDNGPWLIKGKNGGSALPLFEGKTTHFEGGHRVPAIIRWPKRIPANSVCREVALSMDIFPTLAHIVGAEMPRDMIRDGKNILKLWTVEGEKSPHEFFFYGKYAVRSGPWKYHHKEVYKVKSTARLTKGPTLYNLEKDLGESRNLIESYPEIASRLSQALMNNPNKKISKKSNQNSK